MRSIRSTRPRSMGRRGRVVRVAGHCLLGIVLLALADRSWLLLTGDGGASSLAYLQIRAMLAWSPMSPLVRCCAIGVICWIWQLGIALWRKPRLARWLSGAAWVAALALGGWQYAAWRSFGLAVGRTFAESRASSGSPWVGTFGVVDLARSLTAVSPSKRVAHVKAGCLGIYEAWWGHAIHEGPFLRFVVEDADPRRDMTSEEGTLYGVFHYPPREKLVMDTIGGTTRIWTQEEAGDIWTIAAMQYLFTTPNELWVRPRRESGQWPSDETLAEYRKAFSRFLERRPFAARVHGIRRIAAPPLSLEAPKLRGTLDVGAAHGLLPGMVFCIPSSDRDRPPLQVIAVRDTESDFVTDWFAGTPVVEAAEVRPCERIP